jgi:pyruvate kinase
MRRSIERVAPDRRESAKHLVHYLALKQTDLRDLQTELSRLGLSSLSHCESCVMRSVLEVSERVHESLAVRGQQAAKRGLLRLQKDRSAAMSWETAKGYLHQHTHDMLGPRPDDQHVNIMVTAPSAAEADRAWMQKNAGRGDECAPHQLRARRRARVGANDPRAR